MSIVSNTISGFSKGFKFRRVAGYIFLIQLFLSLLIGILTIDYVTSSIGNSTNLMKIIEGYNHDVFQDLLRFESTGWSMIKTFIWLVLFIYFLLGPFISGGLLSSYHQGKDQWHSFWQGGSKWYFSFLKLNLLVFIYIILVGAILAAITFFFASYSLENMLTEIPALAAIFFSVFLLILYVIYIVSVSTKSKWNMIRNNDRAVWKNFRKGSKEVRSQFFYFLGLGILFLILSLGFGFLSNALINYIPESGFALMTVAFFLQLLVLFFRVFLRNSYYATIIK